MATAFVVVDGQHGVNAQNFYRMFPEEPVLPAPSSLRITGVPVRVQPASLTGLMNAIARSAATEIIVVSHGSPTQLAIRALPNVRLGIDINLVNTLLGNDSDQSIAARLRQASGARVTEAAVNHLRQQIRAVQAKNLRRVELRACRIGRQPQVQQALKRLFGAQSFSAPYLFDSYGRIRNLQPTTNAGTVQAWLNQHPNHETFGAALNQFYWVCDGQSDPPRISHAFAQSWLGVRSWAATNFLTQQRSGFQQGTIYYHVMVAMNAGSSQVRGSRTFTSRFLFPNDPSYRQNLRRIT